MALTGMTGFARVEGAAGNRRWVWEARSVNGRSLDVRFKLPPGFEALEQSAREIATRRFRRGSMQIALSVTKESESASALRVDMDVVEALLAAAEPLVAAGRVGAPRWDGLLQVRGVLRAESEIDDAWDAGSVLGDLERLFVALAGARAEEGQMLTRSLSEAIDRIEAGIQEARGLAATAPEALATRLRERIAAVAAEITVDPARLAQEVALLASKADVQEELERLAAHAQEARTLLSSSDPVGRRFEFLTQEFNREANTLCSKAFDLALTRVGLDLKASIDQLREQCANVE
jgi:uncharacterized protein (TIGR00255 family)